MTCPAGMRPGAVREGADADAALVDRPLAPPQRSVIGDLPGRRASVIAREDDDGVVADLRILEGGHDLPDRLVHRRQHAGVGAADAAQAIERLRVGVGHLVGAVDGIERQVQEQGLRSVPLADPTAGFLGDQLRGVALVRAGFVVPVPVEDAVALVGEVIDRAEPVPVLVVEPAGRRPVFRLEFSQVPLAGDGGLVARLAQGLRERALRKRQTPFRAGAYDRIDPGAEDMPAGHQRGPGRRAERLDVVGAQDGPALRQCVQVGRAGLRGPHEPGVGIAHVIGHDQHDVRPRRRAGAAGAGDATANSAAARSIKANRDIAVIFVFIVDFFLLVGGCFPDAARSGGRFEMGLHFLIQPRSTRKPSASASALE